MAESDLSRAQDEYGSAASPYADLSSYLMQRPVYDRGTRADPVGPTMRTLDATQPSTEDLLAKQYEDIMAEQTAANEAAGLARQTEINALRDALREELASSEDAALSQRSDLTKSLEGRIDELRRGVDAETLGLRQAGLDERAELARQIEEGDKLVREAQTAAIGDLSDRQGSLIGDLKTRIGSLSGDLTDINSVIESNFQDLLNKQQSSAAELSSVQQAAQTATEQELQALGQQAGSAQDEIGSINQQLESLGGTQAEIDSLNQQLETLYTDVDSGNAAQSEAIRSETADLVSALEQQIGGVAENLGSLPIESIQNQLSGLSDQTAQFQSAVDSATSERANLASMIDALQTGALSQEDLSSLSQSIAEQRGTDISSALNPLQEQITSLQGQIPAEIDVDALRKQITEEVMGQVGQQGAGATTGTTTAPVTVGSAEGQQGIVVEPEGDIYSSFGPSSSEAAGFNPYAAMNLSDGQADAMGYIPAGSVQDQIDYADNYQGRGGTRPAAPAAAPQVAATTPPSVAVAPPPAIQGGASPKQPTIFNPAAFRPENMRFMR